MKEILSLTPPEIADFLENEPNYRAEQIFEWLHKKHVSDFDEMKNLPKALRSRLKELFFISNFSVLEKKISSDGNTEKYLTSFGDCVAESVLMKYRHGNSVCISTQAGCKMGCAFCASTESGFQRNLTAGEYLSQVYNVCSECAGGQLANQTTESGHIDEQFAKQTTESNHKYERLAKQTAESNQKDERLAKQTAASVKNIVLMGCGEPLDNFDATLRFFELISHPKGLNISLRNITVSTCGLVPQIYELAARRLQITLAVSLHAPTDEIRKVIMPVAKTFPLPELIAACKHYAEKTRRRVTFEYALIKGLNDSPSHAKALSKLLKGLLCHVNLIPINKARSGFSPTPRREIEGFAAALCEKGIQTTVRRSLGGDIDAACGQLRAKAVKLATTNKH